VREHRRLTEAAWAPDAPALLEKLGQDVYAGMQTPGHAADTLVHRFLNR
jgi:hypothetical protein